MNVLFFVQLGAQIAELRKAQGITQIQMAEALGVSQQTVNSYENKTVNSYEVARRRVPVSALPVLARLLKVSADELLGEQAKQSTANVALPQNYSNK